MKLSSQSLECVEKLTFQWFYKPINYLFGSASYNFAVNFFRNSKFEKNEDTHLMENLAQTFLFLKVEMISLHNMFVDIYHPLWRLENMKIS